MPDEGPPSKRAAASPEARSLGQRLGKSVNLSDGVSKT